MNTAEALEGISKALSILALQTTAENAAGMLSKNRISEDIILPVFQKILNAPSLRNANSGGCNFPYVDLVDDHAGVAIQVTAERKSSKVTDTLTGFADSKLFNKYKRLVFFILAPTIPKYSPATKKKWAAIRGRRFRFDPSSDIVNPTKLFPLIAALPYKRIIAIHDALSQSVVGEKYIDIEGQLTRISRRQLDHETKVGKYIPDIFVETRETKQLCRCFSHPALFFPRTLASYRRMNLPSWNHFMDLAGLPRLPVPDLSAYEGAKSLEEVEGAAKSIPASFDGLLAEARRYKEGGYESLRAFS